MFADVAANSYELPSDCPLRPEFDQFAFLNSKKTMVRSQLWQCGLCPKQFKSEAFLERHMSAYHAAEVPKVSSVRHCMRDSMC